MNIKELYHTNMKLNEVGRLIINTKNYPLKNYYKVCERRSVLDLWECEKSSANMKMYLEDSSPDGALYGISYWIKNYTGIRNKINTYIEHGVYFGDLVRENSINSIYKGTITFSTHRAQIIGEKSNKPVYTVGPYIHYASNYYNEEKFKQIKNKLGKTLLFFPTHSIKGHDAKYNVENLINRLKEYEKDYDTIMICLYYKDVQNGVHKLFSKEKFLVVTAGHFHDYNFLSRLKSIISLADHTISMAIGTHIGYCLYLDKSHEIINVNSNLDCPDDTNRLFSIIKEEDLINRGSNYLNVFKEDEDTILGAFFNSGNRISLEQINICDKYWGFSEIKNPKILKKELTGK